MELNNPVKVGQKVDGVATLRVIDAASGKLKREQVEKNMFLGRWYDRNLQVVSQPLHTIAFSTGDLFPFGVRTCIIGTGTSPVQLSDTGIENEVATTTTRATSSNSGAGNPIWQRLVWSFAQGAYVGTVTEISMDADSTTFGNHGTFTRLLLETPIALTASDILEVDYKFSITFNQTQSGTFAAGQRDGATDVNWVLTISDDQCLSHGYRNYIRPASGSSWHNPYANLWNNTYGVWVRAGSSNAASDMGSEVNNHRTRKGTPLFDKYIPSTPGSYVNDQHYRDVTLNFGSEASSYSVGEMIIGTRELTGSNDQCGGGLWRITFDPVLDYVAGSTFDLTFRIAYDITT